MKRSFLPSLMLLIATAYSAQAEALKSAGSTLNFVKHGQDGTGLQLEFRNSYFEQTAPLELQIQDQKGQNSLVGIGYATVKKNKQGVTAEGDLHTPTGTQVHVKDNFSVDQSGFQVRRELSVLKASPKDFCFASSFGWAWAQAKYSHDGDTLMPGNWYGQNQTVPVKAFASNIEHQVLMTREDRLGLPLAAFRDRQSAISLELERIGGTASTFAGETGEQQLVDERFQVGGLGFQNDGHLQTRFTFPGSEDDRPLAGANSTPGTRSLPRFHPLRAGFKQEYTLHFEVRQTGSFGELVEMTTKSAIERAHPPLHWANLKQVYRASMDLLNTVTQPHNGTVSVPFQVTVPKGEIKDTSTQMGFVGMALPCAALLLRDGLEQGNGSAVERAEQVINFWVDNAGQPSGVPKNWADFPALGKVEWRPYPTHLRVASDGMDGLLRAWRVAQQHHLNRPTWLQFARRFGDFLVDHQNPDGSWYGSWNFDGTPHDQFTNASTHPLEFLVDLSIATKDNKYVTAAVRAGEFSWKTVHLAYSYVGGTPDNPNVTDKEAGVIAVRGFLALFDATKNGKWLQAAKQAALFCETWIYWRDLPMPEGVEHQVFPPGRTTVGISLISTGHSGADNFMAIAPFWWYRIYLATGDEHFLRTARFLLHDTKQVMDWDGALKYRYPGLLPEAMSLSTNRGQGVAGWLPWLTFVVAEPLVQLQETFGSLDIDEIEKLPLARRQVLNRDFANARGF